MNCAQRCASCHRQRDGRLEGRPSRILGGRRRLRCWYRRRTGRLSGRRRPCRRGSCPRRCQVLGLVDEAHRCLLVGCDWWRLADGRCQPPEGERRARRSMTRNRKDFVKKVPAGVRRVCRWDRSHPCRPARSTRSGSCPGTAGGTARRSRTRREGPPRW